MKKEKLINNFTADKAGHIFINGTEVHLVERYQIEATPEGPVKVVLEFSATEIDVDQERSVMRILPQAEALGGDLFCEVDEDRQGNGSC